METSAQRQFGIVVIGGSAGSLEALQQIVANFPDDIPAAVFVVTHIPSDTVSAMPHLLSRRGALFATHAIDRAPISPGKIIVCPPGHHLVIERDVMRVVTWAKENGYRPSIDVLFRSAAESYGKATCAVLLSGTLDDGVAGLRAVREAGGGTLVQDPADAAFPDMPRNAITANVADRALPAPALAEAIVSYVETAVVEGRGGLVPFAAPDERRQGKPSVFTCPDCSGTLWEMEGKDYLRFRCRTGHAYSVNSMMAVQRDAVESSLWSAVRILQERGDLLRRLSHRAQARGDSISADRFQRQAQELTNDEIAIRNALSDVIAQSQSSAG